MVFVEPPYCKSCATPFLSEIEIRHHSICASCAENPTVWTECRAALVYNQSVKELLLPLKYSDQLQSLNFLTHMMLRNLSDLIKQADYLIPVPLHSKRLKQRKYNQSALLAWCLSKKQSIEVLPLALTRSKETVPLGHFNKQERQSILNGAFELHPSYRKKLIGKHVILVDDVFTTGATLEACSLILKEQGNVSRVDVSAVAKVI